MCYSQKILSENIFNLNRNLKNEGKRPGRGTKCYKGCEDLSLAFLEIRYEWEGEG